MLCYQIGFIMDWKKLYEFCRNNRVELKEALNNHIEEVTSLTEGADDDEYTVLNHKRNRILKRLLKQLE